MGWESWSTLVAELFGCLSSTAERFRYSVRIAAALTILRATIADVPWNDGLWIVHVSLAEVRRFAFALVIVGVWLRRGCLRLSGIQAEMLVCGRAVVHLNCRLARSVKPYVAAVNLGRVITCA